MRREHGRFRGGYCVFRDRRLIVVNRALPPEQMSVVLAEALQQLPLEGVPLKPAVRSWLEAVAAQHRALLLDVSTPKMVEQTRKP
ncbi:MAG: hypothetical protein NZ960_06130 [Candidatus Kapabacteria bacterium]|nr:hypothetical protein [Candidatus Kapabacteria bacterium]MDW8012553.1 hypothetical protein [Bacteroidota bacterium]